MNIFYSTELSVVQFILVHKQVSCSYYHTALTSNIVVETLSESTARMVLNAAIRRFSDSRDPISTSSFTSRDLRSCELTRWSLVRIDICARPISPIHFLIAEFIASSRDCEDGVISSSRGKRTFRCNLRFIEFFCAWKYFRGHQERMVHELLFLAFVGAHSSEFRTAVSLSDLPESPGDSSVITLRRFDGIPVTASQSNRILAHWSLLSEEQKLYPDRIIGLDDTYCSDMESPFLIMYLESDASRYEIEKCLKWIRESLNADSRPTILIATSYDFSRLNQFRHLFDLVVSVGDRASEDCYLNLSEFDTCTHTQVNVGIQSACSKDGSDKAFTCISRELGYKAAFLGDWGSAGEGLALTAREVNSRYYDSYIFGGDNIYEIGIANPRDPKMEEVYLSHFRDVGVDQFVIEGNHDGFGSYLSQLLYSQYRSLWKAPFYYNSKQIRIRHLSICLVFIDTNQWYISGQLAFIESTLLDGKCSESDYVVVFGHHPIFSAGGHGDDPFLTSTLLEVLKRYKIDLYICGHDHINSVHRESGIAFVVAGSASKKTTSNWYTSASNAAETLHQDMNMYAFASLEFSQSLLSVTLVESETGEPIFKLDVSSRKAERTALAANIVRADETIIAGTRPWTRLAIILMTSTVIMGWLVGIVLVNPKFICSGIWECIPR